MSYFALPSLLFTFLNVSFSRLITSTKVFCYRLLVILLFLFEGVVSSSEYLGKVEI